MANQCFAFIESPFKGGDWNHIERNVRYAKVCKRDCLLRGEIPYASHLYFTQRGILDDRIEAERKRGIAIGKAFRDAIFLLSRLVDGIYVCSAVYIDLGVTEEMQNSIKGARDLGIPIDWRRLGCGWEERFKEFLKSREWMDFGLF